MALLAYVGVDEEGFREVLVVEVAGSEKDGAAYASLLRGLLDRGLRGMHVVVSDDHEEGIKAAVASYQVDWWRCVVHFERNVLSYVPAFSTDEVVEDIKAIFKVSARRRLNFS